MKYFCLIVVIVVITCCSNRKHLKVGDHVLIKIKIVNKLNKIIDESGYSNVKMPLLIKVGNNEVFDLIDNSLVGMELFEEKKIILPPNNAFGNDGVYYLEKFDKKAYVVEPIDTLFATFIVIKIY